MNKIGKQTVMKKYAIFFLSCLAFSCAKENTRDSYDTEPVNVVSMTFTADIATTKTTLVNDNKVSWKAGDAVAVFDDVSSDAYYKFTAQSAGASTILQGEAGADATEFYALYPYRENNVFSKSGTSVSNCYITPDQRPVKNSFYSTSHYMMAKADENGNFSFKNINSFIKFTISEELTEVISINLFGNNNEAISGNFTVDWNNGEPAITAKTSNLPYVSIYNSDRSTISPGDYYIAVIPTEFTKGFTIVLSMSDGTQLARKTSNSITLKSNQILPMKALAKADYEAHNNYFVKYRDGFDLTVGGVTINRTVQGAPTLVCDVRNNTDINKEGVFFVTPASQNVKLKTSNNATYAKYVVFGMEEGQRSKAALASHLFLTDAGSVFMLANLEVSYSADANIVRGHPENFGSIVLNDCSFKQMTRTLFDFNNGTVAATMNLDRVSITNSEFGLNNAAAYILLSSASNVNLTDFIFENNVVYACTTMTDFKLVSGYSGGKGLYITNYTLKNCSFHNTTPANSSSGFMTTAGISGNFISNNNLFVVNPVKNCEIVTIYKPGETLIIPASGECINNYFYSTSDYGYIKTDTYLTNLSRKGSPVKLTDYPLSAAWDPKSGKFGAYTLPSSVTVKIGAQRNDMTIESASLNSASNNYSSENLGIL